MLTSSSRYGLASHRSLAWRMWLPLCASAAISCASPPRHVVAEEPVTEPHALVTASASASPDPSESPTEPPREAAVVVLTRSACRNVAPAYEVSVFADGTIKFVGERNVAALGEHEGHISADDVRALLTRIRQAEFSKLATAYRCDHERERCGMHPCFSAVTVSLDGTSHASSRSTEAKNVPPALSAIERDIDATAGTATWIRAAEAPSR